jgi:hypothetical protein
MLELSRSHVVDAGIFSVSALISLIEEGVPLVYAALENGVEVVRPSTGVANEKFAGVAQSTHVTPSKAVRYERITVPTSAPYTVTLKKTPSATAADRGVFRADTGAAMTLNAGAPLTGEHAIAGAVLTFNVAQAGLAVDVYYVYDLTNAEAIATYGNDRAFSNTQAIKTVSSIRDGVVYTTNYDPAVNWGLDGVNTVIKLGNGRFTIGGAGTTLTNATVASLPTAQDPFLGIRINNP